MYSLSKMDISSYAYTYALLFIWPSYVHGSSTEEVRRANRVTRNVHYKEVYSNALRAIVNKRIVEVADGDNVKWRCQNCDQFLKNCFSYSARRSHLFGCDKRLRKKFSGPYVCLAKGCGHRLHHQGSMYAHIQMKHVPKKYFRYTCSLCENLYSHKGVAWLHIRKCHDDKGIIIDRCYRTPCSFKGRRLVLDRTLRSASASKIERESAQKRKSCHERPARLTLQLLNNEKVTDSASMSGHVNAQERVVCHRSIDFYDRNAMFAFKKRITSLSADRDEPLIFSEGTRCSHPSCVCHIEGACIHALTDGDERRSVPSQLSFDVTDITLPMCADFFDGSPLSELLERETIETARRSRKAFSPRAMSYLLSDSPAPFLSERPKNSN